MIKYSESISLLVKKRLQALPPDVGFMIGDFGSYSRDQLIDEVDKNSDIGKAAIDMQVGFIKRMATLSM